MRTSPRLLVAVVAGTVLLPGVALAKGGPKTENHGRLVSAAAHRDGHDDDADRRSVPSTSRVPRNTDRCASWQSQVAQVEVRIAAQNATIAALESQLVAARTAGNVQLVARLTVQLTASRRSLIGLQAQQARLRLEAPCSTTTTVPSVSTSIPTVSLVPATTTSVVTSSTTA